MKQVIRKRIALLLLIFVGAFIMSVFGLGITHTITHDHTHCRGEHTECEVCHFIDVALSFFIELFFITVLIFIINRILIKKHWLYLYNLAISYLTPTMLKVRLNN